jgi:fumarate reductase flavoprotein subunit
MDNDYDIIIVGGGGAGLAAAITAQEAGARCIVLEADKHLGGATGYSGGVFYACDTSVQRAKGIENDTPQDLYDYLMTLNQWRMRPDLIHYYAHHCGPAIEWLIEQGAEFSTEFLVRSGVDTVERGHSCTEAGIGIANALINTAGARGIETVVDCRVESLLYEDGRVVGVNAQGMALRAGAVIVTTGGFGNNPDMIKRLYPAAWHEGWTWAVHKDNPFILGDGITMGENIGAKIVGQNTGLILPTSGFMQAVEPWLPPWIMAVNKEGDRFMSELSPYSVCGYLIEEQPERRCWAIFDEPTLVEASNDTRYLDPYGTGTNIPTWEEPMIRQQVAAGVVKTAPTLSDLAQQIGVDALNLEATAVRYNRDCEAGEDRHFFKPADKLFPIQTAPFYAVEIRAAIIGNTCAGLDIDPEGRVMSRHGQVIEGLYAAGEVLGCWQGTRYGGGGIAVGGAIVFGRLAGQTAAADCLGA